MDDQPAVSHGCAKALRRGGRLVISCGGAGNAADVVAAIGEVTRSDHWKSHFADFEFPYHFHSPEDYRDWLPAAGFEATRCELVEKDMMRDDANGLGGWLRTTWFPWTPRLPEADREEFLADVVARYLSHHPPDADGRTHVRMVRLEVEALRR